MGMLKEFQDFAIKGNVVDMAVGIVIGTAFGDIVKSLVNDIIMPPVGLLMNRIDFKDMMFHLNKDTAIKYGLFLNNVINFLIVAFAIFLVIQQLNRLKKAPPPAEPATKECPKCFSSIAKKATRCPHCTSELAAG